MILLKVSISLAFYFSAAVKILFSIQVDLHCKQWLKPLLKFTQYILSIHQPEASKITGSTTVNCHQVEAVDSRRC